MKKVNEIWKDIPDYEGLYFVSNLGNITNADGKQLKFELSQRGYYRVGLCKDGVVKKLKVHRIVASAFIPNPYGLPQVNHINECKTDNRVSNLCWTDNRCNSLMRTNRQCGKRKVAIVGKNGKNIAVFESASVAEDLIGVSRYSIISVCNGIQTLAGGLKWTYVE